MSVLFRTIVGYEQSSRSLASERAVVSFLFSFRGSAQERRAAAESARERKEGGISYAYSAATTQRGPFCTRSIVRRERARGEREEAKK